MDREEFLKKVGQQSQGRTFESELVPIMEQLPEYYEALSKRINSGKIDKLFEHSGDTFEYTARLSSKILKYVRTDDSIEVHSIDINQSSDEVVDRIVATSGRAVHSENSQKIYTMFTLEEYLPYLLQDD